jgi:hypothetical protein
MYNKDYSSFVQYLQKDIIKKINGNIYNIESIAKKCFKKKENVIIYMKHDESLLHIFFMPFAYKITMISIIKSIKFYCKMINFIYKRYNKILNKINIKK